MEAVIKIWEAFLWVGSAISILILVAFLLWVLWSVIHAIIHSVQHTKSKDRLDDTWGDGDYHKE